MDRRAIDISGVVQGVGFRPFVFDLANRLGLRGFVRNHAGDVRVEVEGEARILDRFLTELAAGPPPLARIETIRWTFQAPQGETRFRIESSRSEAEAPAPVFISPDVATCGDCLRELFDPTDRRYRYPFLNCTNCGPRLTIVRGVPYDRGRTTLAAFPLCPNCQAEYDDPRDRRFHAQPIACPACGPRLSVLDGDGRTLFEEAPLAAAVAAIRAGQIVAIKGLGGYHLACLAGNETAVAELRRRKHRDEKPFAVMVRDLETARALCEIHPDEEAILTSMRRPIVLLKRKAGAPVADSVSPRNPSIGVMLPYTPLHHLILHDLAGSPIVLTSGNRSDEPIAFDDADAIARLTGIADLFLTHDRPIHLRCDDSVTRVVGGIELPVRRSRGDAPLPIDLPAACRRPTLALGGDLKSTFALGRSRHAFLSHHLGDLAHYEAFRAYAEAIDHYERLFELSPERIVHDLHPDYASTRYALDRERSEGLPRLAVQHHHAHLASCLADNRIDGPVIGVVFDGTGYGLDGTIWGGEFLIGDCAEVRRAAHFRAVPMPGGDRAIREPWRMALSHLVDAGLDDATLRDRIPAASLTTVRRMIEQRLNAPLTSSAGRLFDAVASLAGVRDQVADEGQAAVELEALATGEAADGCYSFAIDLSSDSLGAGFTTPAGPSRGTLRLAPATQTKTNVARRGSPDPAEPGQGADTPRSPGKDAGETPVRQQMPGSFIIDTRPLIAEIAGDVARGVGPETIARRFHSTVVEIVARVCGTIRGQTGLDRVALSGGVFLNALLSTEIPERLEREGFQVFRHRRVPPGDGGLSLGQLAVAAARDMRD